jgi:integrase
MSSWWPAFWELFCFLCRVILDKYAPRLGPQGHRYDPDSFSQELKTANDKQKLKWTCLDFRHSFGSQLAMKGESLYKISTLMGNPPEICRRHYAALIPEELTDSVESGSIEMKAALL